MQNRQQLSRLVLLITAAKLLLLLAVASRYGYFGDEMYHLACAQHLQWGYVDQPPLIAAIGWVVRHTLGDSLFAIRLLPALSGAAVVWLTGRMARDLGGGRFAQVLAALATACAGVYLAIDHIFTMNAFETLLWTACAALVLRIVQTGNQRLWLWFGVLTGLGLENKYSMAVFAGGVVVGLLLTPQRKALAQKWIWIAGALALALFLPNVIWNVQHHWPFFELMRNIRASGRDVQFGPVAFLREQILMMNPFALPIWIGGALALFFSRRLRPYRVLGWTFLTVLATFIVTKGKTYYPAPVYTIVFAAGGVAMESLAAARHMRWLRPVLLAVLLAGTVVSLPLMLPVLPVEAFLRYQANAPFQPAATEQSHKAARLPHLYAWSFGWEEMVASVAKVYRALPAGERAGAAVFARNFAEAGAIDLFGPKYGLPKAISGHQTYFLWGPRNYTGRTMILVGVPADSAARRFNTVQVAAELHHPYAEPHENRPVLLCRGPKIPLPAAWPSLKMWD